MISRDRRIRAFNAILWAGFAGHYAQSATEDRPWRREFRQHVLLNPGWHLYLPQWFTDVVAAALAVAVIGAALRRTRPWVFAISALYALQYLTFPARIRNHMSVLLAGVLVQSVLWLVAMRHRAIDVRGEGNRTREVDAWVARGLAAVIVTTYVFAALHKCNSNFLSLSPDVSAGAGGTRDFLRHGHVTRHPPQWAYEIAVYGTIVCEAVLPWVAWLSRRARPWAVLALMVFHFPHVSTMAVADYPLIACAFYPTLFDAQSWRVFEALLRRGVPWKLFGAAVGVALQIRFVPWWDPVTLLGIFVSAAWGYAAVALVQLGLRGIALRRYGMNITLQATRSPE